MTFQSNSGVRGARTHRPAWPGVVCSLVVSTAAVADVGPALTVAHGLANPRGLDFAPNGDLYVAEAGSGGNGNCTFSPPMPMNLRCYGETGAVTRILPGGGFERVATGLPSLGLADGTAEGGPVDVSFLGTAGYVIVGWGGDPTLRAGLGPKSWMFGSMLHLTPSGRYKAVADVAAHELAWNPAGGPIDSNPYALTAQAGRRLVADAGANAIVEVWPNGRTSTFAVLPPLAPVPPLGPRDAVPTSVVVGPDGGVYVGQLTGFPFWPGTSTVWRYGSDGSGPTAYAGGFTAVVDIAFDHGGALYVLEVARGQVGPFPPPPPNPGLGIGRLLRQCPGGSATVLLEGLDFPGGVVIGPDGAAWLTNKGTSATDGEVLRLPLAPCS